MQTVDSEQLSTAASAVRAMARTTFLLLLLAVSLALLGMISQLPWLVSGARWVAAGAALLAVRVAYSETLLARSLLRYVRERWAGVRVQAAEALVRDVWRAVKGVPLAWLACLTVVCLVPVIHVPVHLPQAAGLYAAVLVVAGMRLATANPMYQRIVLGIERTRSLPAVARLPV